MNESLIREVANQVVNESLLQNWRLYAFILALTLLAVCSNALLKRYFEKRGEVLATSADLQEVLRQLKSTTEVAEQVRAAVSHADWAAREWKTVRRTKLEELVEVSLSLEAWLDEQRSAWFFPSDKARGGRPPTDRVSMLSALYFPELEQVSSSLEGAERKAYAWIVNVAVQSMQIPDIQARGNYYEQARYDWNPLYQEVRVAVARIKAEASGLMQQMRDV
jgi:hypothetical protein